MDYSLNERIHDLIPENPFPTKAGKSFEIFFLERKLPQRRYFEEKSSN